MGKCYKLRGFESKEDFLSDVGGLAYNSQNKKYHRIFKPVSGLSKTKNSISLITTDNKNVLAMVGAVIKFVPIATVDKNMVTFYVGKGLMHKGISMMSVSKKFFFLRHEKTDKTKVTLGHKLLV